jgi:hypothetical protein
MKMVREGCGWLWSCRWRWIDFVTDMKLWIVSWGSGSGEGEGRLGLRKITRFFCIYTIVPLKPNWFGSVGVFPVSGFWNRNRTEPKIFTKILIGLIGFFRFGFFCYFFLSLIGFSVFLLTPTLMSSIYVIIGWVHCLVEYIFSCVGVNPLLYKIFNQANFINNNKNIYF